MTKSGFFVSFKILIISLLLLSTSAYPKNFNGKSRCINLLSSFLDNDVKVTKRKIKTSTQRFLHHYKELNKTLTGNLATVFRSEWKSKGTFEKAASFLDNIAKARGSYDANIITASPNDGHIYFKEFIKVIKKKRRIGDLLLRDLPPPKGSFDKTITYYTKSISDPKRGKHQVRIRRYLRRIKPRKMEVGTPILGFLNGKTVEITKLDDDSFKYLISDAFDPETGKHLNPVSKIISKKALKKRMGKPYVMYAWPHASKFNLEIKTRPHDIISTNNKKLNNLEGQSYVQKLSVKINDDQFMRLFGIPGDSNFLKKLNQVAIELKQSPSNDPARIDAVVNVLRFGNVNDRNFNKILGATEYQRFAFEIEIPDMIDGNPVKIQTTFDSKMGLRDVYSAEGTFLDPIRAHQQNDLVEPLDPSEEMHVELKVPKILVEAATADGKKVSTELMQILEFFNDTNPVNKGKFLHMMHRRTLSDY